MRQLDQVALDKKHTLRVNKLTDIDHYGREGKINDEYTPPEIEPFEEKEHLRSFMADPSGRGRDQFVMYRGESVGVFWNNDKDQPENIVDRPGWTETFVQWSPLGTYLTSVHAQGVQVWGGPSWTRQRRFAHPFVNMVAFSPNENYLVTWSNRPISIPDEGHPSLSLDDDGKNYVIWDVKTSKPLRSFAQLDVASGPDDLARKPAKLPWPAFKWSADDKYVARLTQGSAISVYELPRMNLLDKTTIKVEGVMDFDWAPATVQREGFKGYEQLLCYWTPEIGSNPAKVSLMSIPSKQVVRTLNLFSVSDAKLHWQSEGAYLCVKVDRHSKSKKSQATTLEIFRVKEKGVPVEVVDTIKDTVINFAWEPKGDRFVIITTTEPVGATAVPPKTSVSFFCPEKAKGNAVGNFKHLRTLDKKNSNAIYWSPKGRFVVVATVANTQSSDLDFFDMDFEGEKPESDKDLTANLQLMNTADHYGVTDVEWDPSGRYVATWASAWKHAVRSTPPPLRLEAVLNQRRVTDNVSVCRWRTDTICTTSGASNCAKSPSINSSSGSGGRARLLFSRRRSRRPFARTFGSTRASSSRRMLSASAAPTWRSSNTAAASWRSGTHGGRRSRRRLRRSARLSACPTSPSCSGPRLWGWLQTENSKSSRRLWRRSWRRRRRLSNSGHTASHDKFSLLSLIFWAWVVSARSLLLRGGLEPKAIS